MGVEALEGRFAYRAVKRFAWSMSDVKLKKKESVSNVGRAVSAGELGELGCRPVHSQQADGLRNAVS